MSLEDWMMSLPPCIGGKRPRSPVEKLADLQGQADAEDEDNWRNSKRYLSEVIANGFSRLNFGMQQQQLSPQVLSLASPRATGGSGGCYVQLPGGMLSPRDGGEWDMEMDSPPGCPGSGSSAGQAAAAAAGQRTSRSPSGKGNRPIIVTDALAGQQASPTGSPGGGASGHSPVQYPFGSYVSPGAKPLPPPAWQIATGVAGVAAGTLGAAGAVGAAPAAGVTAPAVPKALKATEKAPNSPSDLPASGSNLRKVALLRSLLARTEQHLQQQQQQQQQHGQQTLEQLPPGQQHLQEQQAHALHQQVPSSCQLRQQQQPFGSAAPEHLPEHGGTAMAATGVVHAVGAQTHSAQFGEPHGQGEHQGLAAAAAAAGPAARGVAGANSAAAAVHHQAACSTHSDDMECSSSSLCDSDSEAHQQRGRAAAVASDADLATSALLCTEVLPLSNAEMLSGHHQQQQQRQNVAWPRHHLAAPKQQQQQGYLAGCPPLPFGPQLPSQLGQHGPWVAQQHNTLQQAQQQQPMRQQVLQPPAQHQQDQQPTSLELTAERLQQLRAKALASTSRLTELEPEDLASLQLSITASQARRGSADHTPSHLHSARAAAEARRHSSHI